MYTSGSDLASEAQPNEKFPLKVEESGAVSSRTTLASLPESLSRMNKKAESTFAELLFQLALPYSIVVGLSPAIFFGLAFFVLLFTGFAFAASTSGLCAFAFSEKRTVIANKILRRDKMRLLAGVQIAL